MMYPYMTLSDGTEINHSQLLKKKEQEIVEVHFERPTEDGFDSARCILPQYEWKFNEGYSKEEIQEFEEFLHRNAHLIFKFAGSGGISCA
mgnify:CR=1 FL=1